MKLKPYFALIFALLISRAQAQPLALPEGTIVAVSPKMSQAYLIDAASGRTAKTLEVGKGPHEVAVSTDGKRAAVANYQGESGNSGSSLSIIDIGAGKIEKTISLLPHRKPHGIAWLDQSQLICTSEESKALLIVDVDQEAVVRTIETGLPLTHMLSLSADKKLVASASIVEGKVSEFDVATGKKLAEVDAAKNSEGIALSPDGHTAWTGNTKADTISVVDLVSKTPAKTMPLEGYPIRAVYSRDGQNVFVSIPAAGAIAIFDAASQKQVGRIDVRGSKIPFGGQSDPATIAFTPDERFAFAAIYSDTNIAIIDVQRREVIGKIGTPANPDGLAFSPLKTASS